MFALFLFSNFSPCVVELVSLSTQARHDEEMNKWRQQSEQNLERWREEMAQKEKELDEQRQREMEAMKEQLEEQRRVRYNSLSLSLSSRTPSQPRFAIEKRRTSSVSRHTIPKQTRSESAE